MYGRAIQHIGLVNYDEQVHLVCEIDGSRLLLSMVKWSGQLASSHTEWSPRSPANIPEYSDAHCRATDRLISVVYQIGPVIDGTSRQGGERPAAQTTRSVPGLQHPGAHLAAQIERTGGVNLIDLSS